jgi:hypothetical protein
VRYAAYWTNDAAAAVAAFKVSPPSADTGRTSGRVGEVTTTYDADGDGMPDWWERVYGGGPTNLSPGGHSDADGSPDLDEWLGGTNPTNAASYLRFDAATAEGGSAVRLSWAGATNRVYGLSRATNLAVASFAGVATNLPSAFPRTSYTDTVGTATGPFFYRLEARPTE